MLATDAKNAENQTRYNFFCDGWKFRRQCVNVIDTTWARIYFSTSDNFGLSGQWSLDYKYQFFTINFQVFIIKKKIIIKIKIENKKLDIKKIEIKKFKIQKLEIKKLEIKKLEIKK